MIDFSKLNTPEANETLKQTREIRKQLLMEQDRATRFMLDYLLNEISELNDYESEFVKSANGRFSAGVALSEKQEAVLNKIFHKY